MSDAGRERALDVVVRPATDDDVAFLRAMIREAIVASPLFVAHLGLDAIQRKEDEYWSAWLAAGHAARDPAFVAVDASGTALGAITVKPDVTPDEHGFIERWRIGLGVVEDARGRGVGRTLIERAIALATARKAREVSLHVDPQNTAAIALYRKLGFAVTKEREHAWEMRIALDVDR